MTRQLLIATVMLLFAVPAVPQPSLSKPAQHGFVTASILQNTSGETGRGAIRLQPGGVFSATNVTVRELVEYAFQRHAFDHREVTSGPTWIDVERYDITAKAPGEHTIDADGSLRETWSMARALLADRFKLLVHEENTVRPVYALLLSSTDGTLGPKLRATDVDCGAVMKGPMPVLRPGEAPPCSFKTPPGRLFANTVGMPTIASLLSQHVDRPVLDRTGLTGRFDMQLEARDIEAPPGYRTGPSDVGLPPVTTTTLFVAVREQLGLKLEPQTAAVPVLVIDHVERPTLN